MSPANQPNPEMSADFAQRMEQRMELEAVQLSKLPQQVDGKVRNAAEQVAELKGQLIQRELNTFNMKWQFLNGTVNFLRQFPLTEKKVQQIRNWQKQAFLQANMDLMALAAAGWPGKHMEFDAKTNTCTLAEGALSRDALAKLAPPDLSGASTGTPAPEGQPGKEKEAGGKNGEKKRKPTIQSPSKPRT